MVFRNTFNFRYFRDAGYLTVVISVQEGSGRFPLRCFFVEFGLKTDKPGPMLNAESQKSVGLCVYLGNFRSPVKE